MDYTYLTLRLVHIFTGVFWAGATIYLARFIIPTVKAIPAEGSKFMQQLAKTNKLPLIMSLAPTLNVICGIILLYQISKGFSLEWFSTSVGMTFSMGGGLAIIAYILGLTVNLPTVNKIAAIGKEIATKGGPPSQEQMTQLNVLRKRLFNATNVIAWLLALTVIAMSIGKYV